MSLDLSFISNMNKDIESVIQDYKQGMEDFDKHNKKMKKVNKDFQKYICRCFFCKKPILFVHIPHDFLLKNCHLCFCYKANFSCDECCSDSCG